MPQIVEHTIILLGKPYPPQPYAERSARDKGHETLYKALQMRLGEQLSDPFLHDWNVEGPCKPTCKPTARSLFHRTNHGRCTRPRRTRPWQAQAWGHADVGRPYVGSGVPMHSNFAHLKLGTHSPPCFRAGSMYHSPAQQCFCRKHSRLMHLAPAEKC